MAARTKSYVTPKYKTKYKVRSWPAYEASLRKRGDVTVWFDEACAGAWRWCMARLPAEGETARSTSPVIGRPVQLLADEHGKTAKAAAVIVPALGCHIVH